MASSSSGKDKEKSPSDGAISSKSGNNSDKKLNKAPNQMKAIGTKRIMREIEQIKANPIFVEGLEVNPNNIKKWFIIIKPRINPYKHGAFKVKMDLLPEYPFKPPRMQFMTPIYHPNIDKQGNFCLSVIQMDNWKTTISIETILSCLMSLIEKPEPERSLRMDLGDLYIQQHDTFLKLPLPKPKTWN